MRQVCVTWRSGTAKWVRRSGAARLHRYGHHRSAPSRYRARSPQLITCMIMSSPLATLTRAYSSPHRSTGAHFNAQRAAPRRLRKLTAVRPFIFSTFPNSVLTQVINCLFNTICNRLCQKNLLTLSRFYLLSLLFCLKVGHVDFS